MAFKKPSRKSTLTIAIYAIVALIFALVLFHFVGSAWAFVGLLALWISGNMVAWFNRHPPPPHNLDR